MYVPQPHPRYSCNEPFLPGYRGHGGAYGEEMWNPNEPPCVPSDERPDNVFGSEEAARATVAVIQVENKIKSWQDPDLEYDVEWAEENAAEVALAKVQYKHSLSKLAAAFPLLEVPVAKLYAGLPAQQQRTRFCPCGAGRLPQWPWVLQTEDLGFCPGAVLREDVICGKHIWEDICWRGE